jgi:hypothetical protein
VNAVRRAAELLFSRQVRLRWRGGPKLSLERRDQEARAAAAQAEADRQREHRQTIAQLAELLDESPEVRDAVRHLSGLEQALRRQGPQALYCVPLEQLQQALQQFEGLVSNWSPTGLASLRSKMAVAVLEREGEDESGAFGPVLSAPARTRPGGPARLSAGRR